MTTALWCVLVAALMHIPFTAAAKLDKGFDNHHPRDFLAGLQGWRRRANAVQLNSLEAFPFFAAGVIIAQMLHTAEQARIDHLALAFIGVRVMYGLCYVADLAVLRSLTWFAGVGCTVALFVISA